MTDNPSISHPVGILEMLCNQYNVCIILPTYNNAHTIGDVIQASLQQTSHILVVNDGSTDDTESIVSNYPVTLVTYTPNKGKGMALRTGFRKAIELGYDYAITIDTDGQHFPADCKQFLDTLKKHPDSLMIGSRNMQVENVPGKSSFGNKFSNFWFWIETGIKMPDTQSGFRLYPIHLYKNSIFFTRKYEFEIEIIVRSAWNGIPILNVPIQVYYPKKEERVSHFRPFKDFFRISVLNTCLVLIAFLYIKPRDLLIKPIREKGWRGFKEILFNPNETAQLRAMSVGFGIFMGIIPIWGFQLLIGIPIAVFCKMNKTLFIVAANISIFPPIIWAASLAVGKLIYQNPHWRVNIKKITWEMVMQTGKEFFVGGTVLAIVGGLLFYALTLLLLNVSQQKKSK